METARTEPQTNLPKRYDLFRNFYEPDLPCYAAVVRDHLV